MRIFWRHDCEIWTVSQNHWFFWGIVSVTLTGVFCHCMVIRMKIRHICRKKLKSDSGVSLSVALLFFVVCAVLASMILASAYSASSRVGSSMDLNQDHYSADSAAALISQKLQNDVIVIEESAYVRQNEDGSYQVQAETDKDGRDISITSAYYEVDFDAAGKEVPTILEDFDIARIRNVTKADDQSLLVKEYTGMYSSYLSSYGDATKKIYQAKLANAALDSAVKSRSSSFDITVGEQSSLNAHAEMTLASDLSLDIVVTSGSASVHVRCKPEITTTYGYESSGEDDVSDVLTVTKTTVISFGKAEVTRS